MLLCEDIAEQKVSLGSQLSEEQEKTLIRFLFNNKDVFAWLANNLCGVSRDVIEHSLNVDPSFRPVADAEQNSRWGRQYKRQITRLDH
jgi:hypothetical protein